MRDVDWILLAHDEDTWRFLVNMIMELGRINDVLYFEKLCYYSRLKKDSALWSLLKIFDPVF
jgi:hypothetical protein